MQSNSSTLVSHVPAVRRLPLIRHLRLDVSGNLSIKLSRNVTGCHIKRCAPDKIFLLSVAASRFKIMDGRGSVSRPRCPG